METERTFIHHKTGKPTTMNTTNIGKSQPDLSVGNLYYRQAEIEPIIVAELAYQGLFADVIKARD